MYSAWLVAGRTIIYDLPGEFDWTLIQIPVGDANRILAVDDLSIELITI